ncbi:mediator of DNA damage checkpoint protein 1 isoform X2 [Octopus bimaculoides]|uniref:mediator of DNA damage checkpoint protein 1 isoform X2 n=1 Tax=Octopus bimaculoides TaxID=37653 RepID=UPI00071DB3BD|nr:mediator of DNA damage checkpoint protein 1 isoform X2 [Octopus bimaculoides]|eukprot:XP_014779488.1 PREDICTED: mediator of DNA damage checkpoint protein 1-like isoform X2 [Octopus bimaculoides]
MDLDVTQAITFSDVEDDAEKSKLPVAHLTILNHQALKNKLFPIFRGKNIIGRHEHSCEVCIPVKSLSKKHACIEVTGRSHLLYDMSSRNKSRRGTLFLTPEVRYELKHKDTLVFADVSCQYAIEEIARASDSGSNTESMSDLEDELDEITTNTPTILKSNISLQLENSNSSSSSDILLPTQDFPVHELTKHSSQGLANISPVKAEVLAVDSSPENQGESSYLKDRIFFQNNESKSEVYDTENPIAIVADTQSPKESQKSNHDKPEDLPKETNKPKLNSSRSSPSQSACGESEGFKTKSSSEMPVNTKPEEKVDYDLFFMSTYKNDIEISDEELSPASKSPMKEPVTITDQGTLPATEAPVDQDPNESLSSANKSPESKLSSTINKSTVSSPVMDTVPVGSFQKLASPVDKTVKAPSNTSTPMKETVPLSSTLMETVEVVECVSPEKQPKVAMPLETVAIETFSETLRVQEDKVDTSSPAKNRTTITSRNLSLVSSPKAHALTECSENFSLDATQPYALDSSISSPNTKKLSASTPKTPDKTQPLRQSCGLDIEVTNDSVGVMKDSTPVKNKQSESPVQTPKRSRAHSISSDEESLTDEPNFKDKPILEGDSNNQSKDLQENIPSSVNTLSGDIFSSGKSSQTTSSSTPDVTETKYSGESNAASLVPAVEEQTDLETKASEKSNVIVVSTSKATDEELPVELEDNETISDIEEDIKRSKRLKKDATSTPVSQEGKRLLRNTRKNTKSTDTPSELIEIPELQSGGKRSLRNHPETSDSHSKDKKSKVRKSIRFDLPDEESSSEEENYLDKNVKRSSNRSKKSSADIKDDKANKKLSKGSDSKLADLKNEECSEDSKTKMKSKTGRGKRTKMVKSLIESEMEADEDFVEKKSLKSNEITVEETENISLEVKEENVGDISVLSENTVDSRKSGRGLRGKSKQNKEKAREEISDFSNTTKTYLHVDIVSEDSKVTRKSGRALRSKSVKEVKEPPDGSALETSNNNTPSSRGRSTRGAKKEVAEDKAQSKKGGKVSSKKSLDSNKQIEEEPCQKSSNEETKSVNQKEDMEVDKDDDSKTKSNIEEENTEEKKNSQSRTPRNKRKKSDEDVDSKISERNSKKKKIASNEETGSSQNTPCSLKQKSVSASKDHAENLNLSSDVSADTTAPSKTTPAKRTLSKRQLSHLQDTKEDASEMQEMKTPAKRRENQRTASQSSNESSNMATPKNLKSNQFISPRRNNGQLKPNVMFTGLTDDTGQRIVTELGGIVGTNFNCCTHLITDKVRRTVKFLCCLARGIPIVSLSWLTKCKSAKTFIDYTPYILSDSDAEKQYNFSLSQSLELARSSSPLKGYKIHVTKSVKPNAEQMKEIIESCKAKFLAKLPTEFKEETIVISCEDDKSSCKKAIQAGIPIVEAEFLLTGILQQDLSIDKYQIFQTSPTSEKCKQPAPTEKKSRTTRKTKK